MSLTSGSTLAHYEIVELIGKGGMGEVYQSRDTKLGRDVAIKILPEAFSRDNERAERFQREARVLAQLNHANIATLHGFEEADGRQFLVMELVEGETLAERVARRPLSLNEAAQLFGPIADAIESAHARGIVHRDLKPANIKLTTDGKPKILDYGLARAWTGDPTPDSDDSHAPTLTKDTELGAVMGTPAYMSPEQARGEPVDGRTDVWAFGCCFYETLTGRKAFPGETTADVFAAIMNETPQCVTFPERVRRLLGRCLEKDVHQRLRGLEHARLELEALTEADASPRSGLRLAPWLVATFAVALAVIAFLRPAGETSEASPVRLSLQLPSGDQLLSGFAGNLAISRDGKQVAYVGIRGMEQYSLFLRRLDRLDPELVPGSEGAGNPFFSPDGLSVGFSSIRGPLKRAAVGSGTSVELAPRTDNAGAFWGADGYIYFSPQRGAGIARMHEQGSDAEIVVPLRQDLGDTDLGSPHLLPGGDSVLFVARQASGRNTIAVQTLRTGERRTLIEDGNAPQYVPSGHLVFGRAGIILAVPFDLDNLLVNEPSTVVVDALTGGAIGRGNNQFAISNHGTLLYVDDANSAAPISQLVSVDQRGTSVPLLESPRRFWGPRWSPSDNRLAVAIYDEQRWDLWAHDVARDTLTRLTFSGRSYFRPLWSPDGSRLFEGTEALDPNAGGGATRLITSPHLTVAASASRDGETLVYRQSRPETGYSVELHVADLALGAIQQPSEHDPCSQIHLLSLCFPYTIERNSADFLAACWI